MTDLEQAIERLSDMTTDLFTFGMAAIKQANENLQEINDMLEAQL